jgi:CRISPR/Cas system CSM-associated protein Csm3 (group 7 of RAMP superfamily)
MEYIGKVAEFTFILDVYEMTENDLEEEILKIFSGLKNGEIQFGGKKSSGAGNVILTELKFAEFNLKNKEERKKWITVENNKGQEYKNYIDKLQKNQSASYAYRVIIRGKTESSIQVKGISVSTFGKDAPDSENIQNAKEEYIVPGSSFKGTVRSQMEKIAEYVGNPSVVKETFGVSGEKDCDGKAGNIVFYDAVIGDKEWNKDRPITHRIHIDKFTGGVFNRGLFSEKNAAGEIEFIVDIKKKNQPDATLGLLILAMRDLAVGLMSIGNGYNIGKGMIIVKEIIIENGEKTGKAVLSFENANKIEDPQNIIASALVSLKGGSNL